MQVKTQKQVTTLQNKAQKVADKLNEEVITITKGVQHIQVQAGVAYQLNTKDFDTKKLNLIAKKVGDDLEVALEEGVVIFDNYFNICATELSCLVSLPAKDNGLYHIVADVFFTLEDGTQVVYFYGEQSIVSTESSTTSEDSGQSFEDIITSNIEIAIAAAVAVIAIIVSSSSSDDDKRTLDDPEIKIVGTIHNNVNQITVKAESGSKITVVFSANNETVTRVIESASGDAQNFSPLTETELNKLGSGSIKMTVTLTKDGAKESTSTSNFMLDIVAPSKPTIEVVATDDVINFSEKGTTITGTTEADSTVMLSIGNNNKQATVTGTTWVYTLTDSDITALGQGSEKIITATATDAAGNATVSENKVVVVDTLKPQPTISLVEDTGSNNTDKITNNKAVSVSDLENNATRTYSLTKNGNQIDGVTDAATYNAYMNGGSEGSKIDDAVYKLTITDTDVAGNVGDTTFEFTLDTTAPNKPTINMVATDDMVNASEKDAVNITGTAVANSTIMLAIGNQSTSVGVAGDGTWTHTLDATGLDQGSIIITATATDIAGNAIVSDDKVIVLDTIDPIMMSADQSTTIYTSTGAPSGTIVFNAKMTNLVGGVEDEGITYSIKEGLGDNASKFSITSDTGYLAYNTKQDLAHNDDTVTIIATDMAGNTREQSVTVSVVDATLATTVAWSNSGTDAVININEMKTMALGGTVSGNPGTGLQITSIVFKQGDAVIYTIDSSLPVINETDKTWALANDDTWISKLTDGDYTVAVNLSGDNASIGLGVSTAITVDMVIPMATMAKARVLVSGEVSVMSSEKGTAYLVEQSANISSDFTKTDFDGLVTSGTAINAGVLANSHTVMSTTNMSSGSYVLYVISESGNVSSPAANQIDIIAGNSLGVTDNNDALLIGGTSDDTIEGGTGNDALMGGAGDDTLIGGAGSDAITGGVGNDTLTGGTGVDTFFYTKTTAGNDTIEDFTLGSNGDKLDFSELLLAHSFAQLQKEVNVTDSNGDTAGGDLIIKVKVGNTSDNYDGTNPDFTITLKNVGGTGTTDPMALLADNFIINTPPVVESWAIGSSPSGQLGFGKGDVVTLTLTFNEALQLGDITGSKVVIGAKEFELKKDESTTAGNNKLVFQYTVVEGDNISSVDFNVNLSTMILNNIKGVDDNQLTFADETVKLGNRLLFSEEIGNNNPFDGIDVGVFSKPTFADINNDGKLDLIVGSSTNTLEYFQNTSSQGVLSYTKISDNSNPFKDVIGAQRELTPAFADINDDGVLELLVGGRNVRDESSGNGGNSFYYYVKDSTSGQYVEASIRTSYFNFSDTLANGSTSPTFVDIDGDGDLDLISGQLSGGILYYKNVGTKQTPVFEQKKGDGNPFNGLDIAQFNVAQFIHPTFGDVDGDGDLDLVVGSTRSVNGVNASVLDYYQNIGTSENPVYEKQSNSSNPFDGVEVSHGTPVLVDVDGDGYLDVITGESGGTLQYFRNQTFFVDTTAPTATITVTTILVSANISVMSSESGTAYLVKQDTSIPTDATKVYFDGLDSSIAASVKVSAMNEISLSTTSNMTPGSYILYTIDEAGNISSPTTNQIEIVDADDNTLTGTDSADILIGGTGNDTLNGGIGHDTLSGGAGDDTINGGAGNDTLAGNADNDTISGGTGDDTIDGGTGNDTLSGNADDDILSGGDGNDNLDGGADNDKLIGGSGADTLTGGEGADIFDYDAYADSLKANCDTIVDFNVMEDKLDFSDLFTAYRAGPILSNLSKYINATVDDSDEANVNLYIASRGITDDGIVDSSNANALIKFTVADAVAQNALVAALNNNTFDEYIF